MKWKIRKARTSDVRFIIRTFINASKRLSKERRVMKVELYNHEMLKRINKMMDRKIEILVACDTESDDVIYSFMIYEGDRLYFCYTKKNFRKFNIMKSLIEKADLNKERIEVSYQPSHYFLKYLKSKIKEVDLNIFNL